MNINLAPPAIPIAFFDLDRTVTDIDTDYLWSKWLLRRSPKGLLELFWLYSLMKKYDKGVLEFTDYLNFQKFRIGHKSREAFTALANNFFLDAGIKHIRPAICTIINVYRQQQTRLVLLTAQNSIIAEPFANHFGFDKTLGTEFEFNNNRATLPIEPYCYQAGKIYWAQQYADSMHIKLEECAFFSDSINDLPLLQKVKFPIIVDPDKRLTREALINNWPII